MERIYFLLTGIGPEFSAVKKLEEICDRVGPAYRAFAEKWYPEGCTNVLANERFLGVEIPEGKRVPNGFIKHSQKYPRIFKPHPKRAPEAFKEMKALPVRPFGDFLNDQLRVQPVQQGRRTLFLGYSESPGGDLILSVPVNDDLEFYLPVGPHKELLGSDYLRLMKPAD